MVQGIFCLQIIFLPILSLGTPTPTHQYNYNKNTHTNSPASISQTHSILTPLPMMVWVHTPENVTWGISRDDGWHHRHGRRSSSSRHHRSSERQQLLLLLLLIVAPRRSCCGVSWAVLAWCVVRVESDPYPSILFVAVVVYSFSHSSNHSRKKTPFSARDSTTQIRLFLLLFSVVFFLPTLFFTHTTCSQNSSPFLAHTPSHNPKNESERFLPSLSFSRFRTPPPVIVCVCVSSFAVVCMCFRSRAKKKRTFDRQEEAEKYSHIFRARENIP